jgi:hypothetical protein
MKRLNKVKAEEIRKLQERTEARIAQLEIQQAQQDRTEVLELFALLSLVDRNNLLLCKIISCTILNV